MPIVDPVSKTLTNEANEAFDFNLLSAAERKAIIYMRELKPYQRIEVKLKDNHWDEVSVSRHEILREDFPVQM